MHTLRAGEKEAEEEREEEEAEEREKKGRFYLVSI